MGKFCGWVPRTMINDIGYGYDEYDGLNLISEFGCKFKFKIEV
jgi:hypothetical protein